MIKIIKQKNGLVACLFRAYLSTCAVLLDTAHVGMSYMPYYQPEILYKDLEGIVLLLLFYVYYRKRAQFREDTRRLKILAWVFAIIVFLGRAYLVEARADTVLFSSFIQLIKSVCLTYGLFCVIYSALGTVYEKVFYASDSTDSKKYSNLLLKIFENKHYILVFIMICWLPYWIINYPGSNSYDAGYALHRYYDGGYIGNAMPAFQLYLFMLPLNISKALFGTYQIGYAFYSFAQMLFVAIVVTLGVHSLCKYGASKRVLFGIVLFFALIPVFPLHAIALCDDTPFAAMMCLYSLFWLKLNIEKKTEAKTLICLFVVLVLSSLFRHQGIYVVAIGLIISVVLACKGKKYYIKVACIHGICIILIMAYNAWVLPHMLTTTNSITSAKTQTIMSLVLVQQFAGWYSEYGEEIEEQDYNELESFVEFETIRENYNPDISDSVMKSFNQEKMTSEEWKAFYGVWIKYGLRYPDAYIRATINMTYGYLYPSYRSKAGKAIVITGSEFVEESPTLAIEHPSILQPARKTLTYFWRWLLNNPVSGAFFNSGIYTWMMLFAISIIWIRKYNKGLLMMLYPSFITLMVCFASPVNGYVRYALPIMLTVPLLLGVFTIKDETGLLDKPCQT